MELLICGAFLTTGILIGVFIGIFIGVGRMQKSIKEKSVGHLRIDRSEADEPPKPFLELMGNTVNSISKKDFIVLKIVNKDYISRD